MQKYRSAVQVMIGVVSTALSTSAAAAPVIYQIDSNHTYPLFEADHLGGLSVWRGKINSTIGTVVLDEEQETGTVDVTMIMNSIDFGHDQLNDHARSEDMFDVANFPTASYTGQLVKFVDGAPTAVEGTLTLHGVSQPVNLVIEKFLCKPNPFNQQPSCGADATAEIDRSDFGIDFGRPVFDMGVTLRISIEAIAP